VRSCIAFDAFCGSSQSFGSSASAFSSARRFSDFSTSKRPPQQFNRLLDFFDEFLGFRAHFCSPISVRLIAARALAATSAGYNNPRPEGAALMKNVLFALAFCLAASGAFAQSDGLGQVQERESRSPAPDRNIGSTFRSLGLTGTWAVDCSRPVGPTNVYAEFRTIDGKIVQVQSTGGQYANHYEMQEITQLSGERYRVRARFYNVQREEINILEWWIQGKRVRTMSNRNDRGDHFVVDGVIVSVKRETPWLTRCD
jgi:hypothetical protein